jgi:hypothetical protein
MSLSRCLPHFTRPDVLVPQPLPPVIAGSTTDRAVKLRAAAQVATIATRPRGTSTRRLELRLAGDEHGATGRIVAKIDP